MIKAIVERKKYLVGTITNMRYSGIYGVVLYMMYIYIIILKSRGPFSIYYEAKSFTATPSTMAPRTKNVTAKTTGQLRLNLRF